MNTTEILNHLKSRGLVAYKDKANPDFTVHIDNPFCIIDSIDPNGPFEIRVIEGTCNIEVDNLVELDALLTILL